MKANTTMKKLFVLCLCALLLTSCENKGKPSELPDTTDTENVVTEDTSNTDTTASQTTESETVIDPETLLNAEMTPCTDFETIGTNYVTVSALPSYEDLTETGRATIGKNILVISFSVQGYDGQLRFCLSQKRQKLISLTDMTEGDKYQVDTTTVLPCTGKEGITRNWCVGYQVAYTLYLPTFEEDNAVDVDALISALIEGMTITLGDAYTPFAEIDDVSQLTPLSNTILDNGMQLTLYAEEAIGLTIDGETKTLQGGITEAIAYGERVLFLADSIIYQWNGIQGASQLLDFTGTEVKQLIVNESGTVGAVAGEREIEIVPVFSEGNSSFWAYKDDILAYLYLNSAPSAATETYTARDDAAALYVQPITGSKVSVCTVEYLPTSLGIGEVYASYENTDDNFLLAVKASLAPAVAELLIEVENGDRSGTYLLVDDTITDASIRFITVG